MSFFGRNIRKIRIAKNISQTAFADLFALTRASIGAYEEGRAEAKIDTVIEIAEFFHLSLEQLLKKELTINEIYRIREISQQLETKVEKSCEHTEIPLVITSEFISFISNFKNSNYLKSLPPIVFPGIQEGSIAFEYNEEMGADSDYSIDNGDLLIGKENSATGISNTEFASIYLVCISNNIFLAASRNEAPGELVKLGTGEVFDHAALTSEGLLWQIYMVVGRKKPADGLEKRLLKIEQQLEYLIAKGVKMHNK